MKPALWLAAALLAHGPALAAECTPQELMAKVGLLTQLLDKQMQQPTAARRVAVSRMNAAMARHPGVTDYQGVCAAYDDLLQQLGSKPPR